MIEDRVGEALLTFCNNVIMKRCWKQALGEINNLKHVFKFILGI